MANVNMINNVGNVNPMQNGGEAQRSRVEAQKEAVKTQKESSTKAQEAQQNKEKEKTQDLKKDPGDLVYMSDDGDTVRVSQESNGSLEDGVFMKTGSSDDEEKVTIELEDQNKKAEEAAEKREELREEQQEDAEKIAEKAEAQNAASFAGVSESRLQQMLRDGAISQFAYEKEIESRENARKEESLNAQETSEEITKADEAEKKTENSGKALENAFAENSPYSTDTAKDLVEAMDRMSFDAQAQNAAEKLSVNTATS